MTVHRISRPYYRRPLVLLLGLGFAFLLIPTHRAMAQGGNREPVTLDLQKASMADVLKQVEKQTGHRFFYDTLDLDTTKIDLKVDGEPWPQVLSRVFTGTELSFSTDKHGRVFIVKGAAIATDLPPDFFDKRAVAEKSAGGGADSITDYLDNAGKTPVSTLENKLFVIGDKAVGSQKGLANLAGYARDAKTGEPIAGAAIYVENPRIGVITDQYGYFSLSIPKGRHVLNIQSIGMHDTRRLIVVYGDGKLNIDLVTQIMTLKKVIVSAEKASNIRKTDMGVQKLDIKTIKQVPVVFGEADILRVMTTLPGVKTVGEASTGLNVRGGATDQNLVLFNDATIYNTAHFFGLFSVFNPEVVKDVELYKSSIPAKFGGRLSSVLDISSREGNKKDFTGSAGDRAVDQPCQHRRAVNQGQDQLYCGRPDHLCQLAPAGPAGAI